MQYKRRNHLKQLLFIIKYIRKYLNLFTCVCLFLTGCIRAMHNFICSGNCASSRKKMFTITEKQQTQCISTDSLECTLTQTQSYRVEKQQKKFMQWPHEAYLGWIVSVKPRWLIPTSLSEWAPLRITVTYRNHTIEVCISIFSLFFGRKLTAALLFSRRPKNLNILSKLGKKKSVTKERRRWKKNWCHQLENTLFIRYAREETKKFTKYSTLRIKKKSTQWERREERNEVFFSFCILWTKFFRLKLTKFQLMVMLFDFGLF